MSAFDRIIGYTSTKKELQQICDTLKHGESYERLGVSKPRGLLLHGVPGVGKSLMAEALIEESGRQAFTCRKNKPNGAFVDEIKNTFDKAVENAPSIVFLDDMDKFANGDEGHRDAEEYVTVQSCIDQVKGKDVYVLATVNNMRCLPGSLYRAGRFDRVMKIDAPQGKDAVAIIDYYLKNKKSVDEVDAKTIARLMQGKSCAELETLINEAGLYAGFERSPFITMEHLIKAVMRTIVSIPYDEYDDYDDDDDFDDDLSRSKEASQVVYHEAGHAVAAEVLCPDSVTLVAAYDSRGKRDGITMTYDDGSYAPDYWYKTRIVVKLAGRAAIDRSFGTFDMGCVKDLEDAFSIAHSLVVRNATLGLNFHSANYPSENLKFQQEAVVAAEIEHFYAKAKELLYKNKEFYDKLAAKLGEKGVLSALDIQRIKETCTIVPVDI